MPPSERPASANFSAGIWSTTQRAAVSQLSQMDSGALRQSGTTMSAWSARAATWAENKRGEHSTPGTSSRGVLVISFLHRSA